MTFGSSGLVTYGPNPFGPSSTGRDALNLSLSLSGITTSLTSGDPSLETLRYFPLASWREVVDHTPITASFGPRRSSLGTWTPRVFTLKPANVSLPTSERFAPYSRSKTRRSRKNGSSA